jgi:hypothetical protein
MRFFDFLPVANSGMTDHNQPKMKGVEKWMVETSPNIGTG